MAALIIQGALANAPRVETSEVDAVLEQVPCSTLYRFAPREGVEYGAAFDWTLILDIAADLASISSGLWLLYEKFIGNEPERERHSAFLLVQIRHPDGRAKQLTIKCGTSSSEGFEEEFQRAIAELLEGGEQVDVRDLEATYDNGGQWVRVKRYDF